MKRLFKICALGLWASLAWSLWFDQAFALAGLLCFVLLDVFSKSLFFQDIFKIQQPFSSHRIPWNMLLSWLLLVGLSWLSALGKPFEAERSFGLWVMVAVLPLSVFGLRPQLEREGPWKLLAVLLMIVGGYGLVQTFTGVDLMRPGHPATYLSPVSQSNYAIIGGFNRHHTYATVTMLLLLMLGGRLLDTSSKQLKTLGISALVVSSASVLLCPSRAAWLGGLAGAAVLGTIAGKNRKFLWISIGCILIFLLLFPPSRERLLQATQRFGLEDRQTILAVAGAQLIDHPGGIGYGRFAWEAAADFEATRIPVKVRSGTHSDALSMLVGGGPLLALAWGLFGLSLMMSLGRAIQQNPKRRGYFGGLLAAMVCYHLCALFHNSLQDGEIAYVFWTIVGLSLPMAVSDSFSDP